MSSLHSTSERNGSALTIATISQLVVTISIQLLLQRLGPLLMGKLDGMDTPVREWLDIASLRLWQEPFPSIATFKIKGTDHFYTTNAAEIGTTTAGQVGQHGYLSEGVACYVIPYYG